MKYLSKSEIETKKIAVEIYQKFLKSLPTVLLYGDFGAGKTVFVKGLGQALGVTQEEIRSPSFTYMNTYQGDEINLIHVDLYRLEAASSKDFIDLDYVKRQGASILVIEWAEHLTEVFQPSVQLFFKVLNFQTRQIELKINQ